MDYPWHSHMICVIRGFHTQFNWMECSNFQAPFLCEVTNVALFGNRPISRHASYNEIYAFFLLLKNNRIKCGLSPIMSTIFWATLQNELLFSLRYQHFPPSFLRSVSFTFDQELFLIVHVSVVFDANFYFLSTFDSIQSRFYLKVPRYDHFRCGANYIRHSVELNFTSVLVFVFVWIESSIGKSLNWIMVLSISRFSFESRLCMALYAHDICFFIFREE